MLTRTVDEYGQGTLARWFWSSLCWLFISPAITLADYLRKEEDRSHMWKDLKDPPWPEHDWTQDLPCDSCEDTTVHLFTIWQPEGRTTRECTSCGVTEDV